MLKTAEGCGFHHKYIAQKDLLQFFGREIRKYGVKHLSFSMITLLLLLSCTVHFLVIFSLLLLVCVSFTIIGQPRNSVLICRV